MRPRCAICALPCMPTFDNRAFYPGCYEHALYMINLQEDQFRAIYKVCCPICLLLGPPAIEHDRPRYCRRRIYNNRKIPMIWSACTFHIPNMVEYMKVYMLAKPLLTQKEYNKLAEFDQQHLTSPQQLFYISLFH